MVDKTTQPAATMTFSSNDSGSEHNAESQLLAEDTLPLPKLTDRPSVYSGCCLALSTSLVAYLRSLLPPSPALTLSIGSGFGLLEAILIAVPHQSRVIGVEVEPSPNIYLPAQNHRIVHGTRFLEPLAAEAFVWLFIYPRRAGLINEYMAIYGSEGVQKIVWVGPQADWDDYKDCFSTDWSVCVQGADLVGGRAWELVAVAERTAL